MVAYWADPKADYLADTSAARMAVLWVDLRVALRAA